MIDLEILLKEKFNHKASFNKKLAPFTYYKIGGPARYLLEIDSKDDFFKALTLVAKHDLPFFVIGGASNLLVSDNGFDGLIIRLIPGVCEFSSNTARVFSGNNLRNFIKGCLEKGLTGLEFAAGIPGTVGGAIYGNAGAYGKGVGDFIKEAEIYKLKNRGVENVVLRKEELRFFYRDSILKHRPWYVAEALFELERGDTAKADRFVRDDWKKRCSSQPLKYPSCGCVFKNISFDPKMHSNIKDFESYDKVPAGRLIEEAGLKGKQIGQIRISEKHANFLVNLGGAQATDVVELIKLIKSEVKKKFKVELEEELQYLGF